MISSSFDFLFLFFFGGCGAMIILFLIVDGDVSFSSMDAVEDAVKFLLIVLDKMMMR